MVVALVAPGHEGDHHARCPAARDRRHGGPDARHNDSNFGSGVNAANNWNFTESVACLQEVAAVPVIDDWVGDYTNNCSNSMIDHALGG
ncbi:hypothetical protein [Streptomyces sp. BE133]|uniref:hypothetical protein n=1 Tax=Streptomyces sp. BE133 TaxID=3002523 RepID=UPI002E7695B9|nr:hypothetical protein [Streptomyces sp. BE133]MEE1813325.1 hypothetical protein [Streptomyces sp. BE133]